MPSQVKVYCSAVIMKSCSKLLLFIGEWTVSLSFKQADRYIPSCIQQILSFLDNNCFIHSSSSKSANFPRNLHSLRRIFLKELVLLFNRCTNIFIWDVNLVWLLTVYGWSNHSAFESVTTSCNCGCGLFWFIFFHRMNLWWLWCDWRLISLGRRLSMRNWWCKRKQWWHNLPSRAFYLI